MKNITYTNPLQVKSCCENCKCQFDEGCHNPNCPCHHSPKDELEIPEYDREEWGAWKFVSEMLDNPGEFGIYPTSKCYKQIYDFVVAQKASATAAENQAWREKIKGIQRHYVTEPAEYKGSNANVWREGYNQALTDLLNKEK